MSKKCYTCGECKAFSEARGICLKTGDQRAKINLTCRKFELADDVELDTVLPESAFLAPTPSEKKETKVCKCCGKELPIEQFQPNPKCKDGHLDTCKVCMNAKRAASHEAKKAAKAEKSESDRIQSNVQAAIDNMPSVKAAKAMARAVSNATAADMVSERSVETPDNGTRREEEIQVRQAQLSPEFFSLYELVRELKKRGIKGELHDREEYLICEDEGGVKVEAIKTYIL